MFLKNFSIKYTKTAKDNYMKCVRRKSEMQTLVTYGNLVAHTMPSARLLQAGLAQRIELRAPECGILFHGELLFHSPLTTLLHTKQ
jgi:hypothetical protein